jgi:rare lipoprotein A
VILAAVAAAGCASVGDGEDSAPGRVPDVTAIPDPVPRAEPRSARGNPPFYEVYGRRYYVMNEARGYNERGVASWYGTKFHGRSTSSGEPYDMYAMTAAHKTLPLPTYVRVTHLGNGRSIVVRVNDRGPFVGERIIDLSYAAAVKLGMHVDGTALVEVKALMPGEAAEVPVVDARAGEKPAGPRRIWLQVGAFSEAGNAERLRESLSARGITNVVVLSEPNSGRTLYRVRVGPYEEADGVEDMLGRLRALDIHDAHLADE